MRSFYAGCYLYDVSRRRVLLHLRDGQTAYFPHQWHFFGGSSESGETPRACFLRELLEETEYDARADEAPLVVERPYGPLGYMHYVYQVRAAIDVSLLRLHEGAGLAWIPIDRLDRYDLSPFAREVLAPLIAEQS